MAAQLELEQKPFIELQIEALIEENRIKQVRVNKFIDELEARIVSIKELNFDKLLNKTFRLPILGRPNAIDKDYPKSFKFIPPERLDVVGGFCTSTALKRTNHVDLAIQMPASCFDKKDIKNHRYHTKRALYLAQLGHLLNGSTGLNLVDNIEYSYYQGDFLKPVLIITPEKSKIKAAITFQLFVYPHSDVPFKLSMLTPSHGNVAPRWFFKNYPIDNSEDDEILRFINGDSDVTESPFYNSSILFDMELVSNSNLVYEQIGNQTSIIQALVMTKVWLYQRELHHHFSFIMSMFVAYLQTKQLIHRNMSPYQIFKKIIQYLISTDWINPGISFYDDSKEKIPLFKSMFPIVFISPSGQMNLCFNITIDLYNRLKHEAVLAESILSRNLPQTFELLLLKKIEFAHKFDVLVQIPKCTKKLPMKIEFLKKFLDHGVFIPRVYSESILNLVQRGLTDRVTLIQQSSDHLLMHYRWNLKNIAYNPSYEDSTFTLGLLLEPEKSLRIIDVGPEAQTPEAEEFRKFWGPKCQLRLQNGVISETVVWHIDNFSQRRDIIKFILNHSLKKADINNIVMHYTYMEKLIRLDNVYFRWDDQSENNDGKPMKRQHEEDRPKRPIGAGEELFQRVLNAYNELNKLIRSADLKYLITGVQPISSHLRACSVFPPLPVGLQIKQKSLKRMKGMTLFPEDFTNIGKILHIEPIDILITLGGNKWPNDFDALKAAKTDFLLKLGDWLQEREYVTKVTEDYLDVLSRQFIYRFHIKCPKGRNADLDVAPMIHANLDQLYREKPAFSLTCRLIKRWLACHLMTDTVDSITIETMIAELFQNPEPYTEPASSLCGFKRFLLAVSRLEPKEDNMILLRKICSKAIKASGNDQEDFFRPDFKMFDLIIKLDSHVIQNFFMTVEPPKSFKLYGRESKFKVMPIVGLNIVEKFVESLREKFVKFADFYYDKFGQRIIGVIMKPDSEKTLGGDLNIFMDDIRKMGKKLIDKINIVKKAGTIDDDDE